jgi:hypothetical protein
MTTSASTTNVPGRKPQVSPVPILWCSRPGHCNLCCQPLRGQQNLQTQIALQKQRQMIELRLTELCEADELAQKAVEGPAPTLTRR